MKGTELTILRWYLSHFFSVPVIKYPNKDREAGLFLLIGYSSLMRMSNILLSIRTLNPIWYCLGMFRRYELSEGSLWWRQEVCNWEQEVYNWGKVFMIFFYVQLILFLLHVCIWRWEILVSFLLPCLLLATIFPHHDKRTFVLLEL